MDPMTYGKEKTIPHGLNAFARDVHRGAVLRGETEGRDRGDSLALCQREIERAQAHREATFPPGYIYSGKGGRPSGIPFNLANCVLHILVYCVQEGIDLEKTLAEKNHYDQTHYAYLRQKRERGAARNHPAATAEKAEPIEAAAMAATLQESVR